MGVQSNMKSQKNRLIKLSTSKPIWILTACSYVWIPLSLYFVFVGWLPWDSPFLIGYHTAQEMILGCVIAAIMFVNLICTLIALANMITLIRYRAEFENKHYLWRMIMNLYPIVLTGCIYGIALG